MGDYDLSRLSSRSFEQLIQAIAAKIIGPGIVIFGDGPDGGREATFEGPIPYPAKESGWKGYGIVQAKFRQRSQGSTKDGKWALDQLRSELEKFANPERELRKPEYYIFATNVVLTPVQDQGSKDKVYTLVEEFKDELPLKGFDIWDYDKICKFLDACEGIRRSYAAWITPGDVLARVIEWVELQQPDLEEVITNFLQKELLADQYANLEQAGHTTQDRIPLAQVFIDLPTFDQRRLETPEEESSPNDLQPGFVIEVLDAAMERLDPKSLTSHAGYAALEDLHPRPGRFVLIGGPGQGKTTIGQFICQLFRASILKKKDQPFTPEVRRALDLIETQCCDEDIQLPSAPRFPIRIALSDFASKLASSETSHVNSVLSYMADRIRKTTDREISVHDFRQWLGAYPWIIILDGLDEVPASSNRDDVLAAVNDFWIDATERNADVLVVATTRPQGYNEDYSPDLYGHKWLAPLSNARAMHYGQRLAQLRYGNDRDRYHRVITRLERALSSEATARLMRSPLQVTIMATLVDRIGQPPQERWRLFKEYYGVIYQRETERPIPAATILRDYKPDIDAIHNRVGLLLQVESDRPGRTEARLSSERFAKLVKDRLDEEGHEGSRLAELKQEIIQAATQRLVFLVGLEADRVGFEIRSLQEYMASEGLMDANDQLVRKRLREIAPVSSWRNVFLFAAGKCFAERQYLRDTIHTICTEMNEDEENAAIRATLAGSHLALDLLEDGPARRQPRYSESLARVALRLLDLPADEHHTRLADLYNQRLEAVYREELEDRLASSNPLHRWAAWHCLTTLIESAVPWAEQLARCYWPQAEDEQKQLLRVAARSRDGGCIISKLKHLLPRIAPLELRSQLDLPRLHEMMISEGPAFRTLERILTRSHRIGYRIPLRLSDATADLFELRHSPVDLQGEASWENLKALPNPSNEWLPFVAAARFLENPSSTTLACELRNIAQGSFSPNSMYGLLPWPMAACLITASNRDELVSLARRAQAGRLGNYGDWVAAETRWLENGVVIEDIFDMTDDLWPFDANIARIGFPFAIGDCRITLNSAAWTLVMELLDIHARLPESHIRSTVADWVIFGLGACREVAGERQQRIGCGQFRTLIQDAGDPLRADTIFSLVLEDPIDANWREVLDYFGRQNLRTIFRTLRTAKENTKRVSNLLLETLLQDTSNVGILRLLSFLVLAGARPSLPLHLLNPAAYDEPKFREAAIILRLTQRDGSPSDAKSLARFTVELASDDPAFVHRALGVISEHNPFTDHYLAELREKLPATHWEGVRRIIRALNESLGRRTSNLTDHTVWSDLGLRPGLHRLLRDQ